MTAKEYLNQIKNLDKKIATKQHELKKLEDDACVVKVTNISDKVKTSHENNSNKIIDKIVDLQNKINAEIDFLIDLKTEAREIINKLDNENHKAILINYYLNNYTFEKCAELMEYNPRWIYRLHAKALKAIESQYAHAV